MLECQLPTAKLDIEPYSRPGAIYTFQSPSSSLSPAFGHTVATFTLLRILSLRTTEVRFLVLLSIEHFLVTRAVLLLDIRTCWPVALTFKIILSTIYLAHFDLSLLRLVARPSIEQRL